MFSIGVVGDEVSQDFQTVVNFVSEFNLDAIEIRSVWEKPPHMLSTQDIDKMKCILNGRNIKIVGIASPFFKCDINDMAEREEHLGQLKACIKLAKAFDTNLIRTFAFWKTFNLEDRWDQVISAYDEPVQIAQNEGIILGMENEFSTSLATAKLTERFVREIDSPNVRAIWDPANEAHADLDGEKPYPNAYDRLKSIIVHVHLKDVGRNTETGELESVALGDGIVDWLGQLQALIDDGYNGHICLETHWRPGQKISDSLLNRPGGGAFSEEGESASRICIRKLFKMVDRLRD